MLYIPPPQPEPVYLIDSFSNLFETTEPFGLDIITSAKDYYFNDRLSACLFVC